MGAKGVIRSYPALPCRAVMALLRICGSTQDHPPVCQCTFIPTLSLEKHERQGWGNRCKALKGVHHMPRLRGAKAPFFHEMFQILIWAAVRGVKRQFVSC